MWCCFRQSQKTEVRRQVSEDRGQTTGVECASCLPSDTNHSSIRTVRAQRAFCFLFSVFCPLFSDLCT